MYEIRVLDNTLDYGIIQAADGALNGNATSCFGPEQRVYSLSTISLSQLLRNGTTVLAALSDGVFAGCACIDALPQWMSWRYATAPTRPDSVLLHTFCVPHARRGTGMGSRLMQAVQDRHDEVTLCVRPRSSGRRVRCEMQHELDRRFDGLMTFYKRMGFDVIARMPSFVVMRYARTSHTERMQARSCTPTVLRVEM